MVSSPSGGLADHQRAALDALVSDLRTIFGSRLLSLVAYGVSAPTSDDDLVRTLGLVEKLTFEDLARLAPLTSTWRRRGLAVPLLLSQQEFDRTLDVFPLEYGGIIADHVVIVGSHPFGDVRVDDADRRRGCELQAKSHLIHLREGFLEAQNDPRKVARLITASAAAFQALLINIARLEAGDWSAAAVDHGTLASTIEARLDVPAATIVDVLTSRNGIGTVADPSGLFARYLDASERIWRYVDGWRG